MRRRRFFSTLLIFIFLVSSHCVYGYLLNHVLYCLYIAFANDYSQVKKTQKGEPCDFMPGACTSIDDAILPYNPHALNKLIAGSIPPEISEIIEFLHEPQRFMRVGATMPRGILLYGPPGTGKTSIARAIAQTAGAPFFYVSGSEFIELYVGLGAKRVREIFERSREVIASRRGSSAIIFIDEIDAIGEKRSGYDTSGEHRQTINQLLNEMDGFNQNDAIIVIAATNRIDSLDRALLRPGRFDRKVFIGLPDRESRKAILMYYLKKCQYDSTINFEYLADITQGMSGADLKNLVNEAAICVVRHREEKIAQKHFEEVLGREGSDVKL